MTDVRIINAEALVVGPDEILIVKLDEPFVGEETGESETVNAFLAELERLGLSDRSVVIAGDVELAKVQKDQPV